MSILCNFKLPFIRIAACYFSNGASLSRPQKSMKGVTNRIVWVDLEMTGLDVEKDKIMEIACLVTDAELNVIAKGPDIIIHQPNEILENMNAWCVSQHGQSGLTEACLKSTVSLEQAEDTVLNFISTHVPEKRCPLGGNSVWMDRVFIRKYMPKIDNYLHYRIIDVSSIKELAKRWYQKDFSNMPMKKFKHRALDDILDTINEMKYYKETIFKNGDKDVL